MGMRRSHDPSCPTCGYDLAGQVATWTVACPLMLTCSECGRQMRAGRAFTSKARVEEWSFEHGGALSLLRWIRTSLRTMLPRSFWKELSAAERAAPQRVLLFAASWAAVCLAAVHITTVVGALSPWVRGGLVPGIGWELARVLAWPYPERWFMVREMVVPFAAGLGLPVLLVWLGIAALCAVRGTFGADRMHLLRSLSYALPVPVLILSVLMAEQARNAHFPYTADDTTPGQVLVVILYVSVLGIYVFWLARWWSEFARHLGRPRLGMAGIILVLPALVVTGLAVLRLDRLLPG